MPSKSFAQHKLMEAAAHTKGGFAGVPQGVGREFVSADEKKERRDGKTENKGKHFKPPFGYGR